MATAINTNKVQKPQENTTIEEEFQYMSREEAANFSIRTRMDKETFSRYEHAIKQVQEGQVGFVKTSDWKRTRANLILVGKKLGVQLVTAKTFDGLQFRVATAAEVKARKKG